MKLRGSDARLYLGVITRSLTVGEELLPVLARVVVTPAEQLFVEQGRGGTLEKYQTVIDKTLKSFLSSIIKES